MNKTVAMISVGVVVALVAGWFGFRQAETPPETPVQTKATAKPVAGPAANPAKANTATAPPSVESLREALPAGEMLRQCEAIFAITNATERKAAFERLLAATTDTAGIKAILQTLNRLFKEGRRYDEEWNSFWHVIGHRDPKGTIALIESYGPNEKWYANAVGKVIQEWASVDPVAAMHWLEGNKALTGDKLDYATLNLLHGYAGRDLKAATAYALSIMKPDDPLRGEVNRLLTTNAMQQGGVDGLLAWYASLPDNATRARAFDSVGSRMSMVGDEQMRAWLAAEAGKPYRNDQTYREYMGTMAQTDPKGALDFAFSLPPSPHQPGVVVGVGYAAFEWLKTDEAAFTSYYNSLPAGNPREQIVKALTDALGPGSKLPPAKRDPALRFLQGLQ